MKIKIWPDDTTVPEMDEWLAELRDEGRAGPSGTNGAATEPFPAAEPFGAPVPAAASMTPPEPPAQAQPFAAPVAAAVSVTPAELHALPEPSAPAERQALPEPPAQAEPFAAPVAAAVSVTPVEPVMPAAPAEPAASPEPAPAVATVRPLIGDQLRMPIIWCEMGSCISWHTDPAALGESDARARAIAAGWRRDAFDRIACPACQQTDPGFRNPYPVVPWDRHTALARAARAAAACGGAHDGARAPGR
jgi:hypothetical protein